MPTNLRKQLTQKQQKQHASLVVATAVPDVDSIRTEQFNGEDHLVVPVIMLVEGVHRASNSAAPELALAEEFGRFPDGWNGRPIVMNHPSVGGEPVSANHPTVLEDQSYGFIFNTELNEKKLKAEAWINLTKVEATNADAESEISLVVEALQAGERHVEVSTGLFTMVEEQSGLFGDDNQSFEGIWRDVVPDHLALLSLTSTGACSVAKGCGAPRTNQEGDADSGGASSLGGGVDSSVKPSGGFLSKVLEGIQGLFGFKAALSDSDRRTALQAALDKTSSDWFYVVAVFENEFVYESYKGLYKRSFGISEAGQISLGSEIMEVRPVTEFVEVNVNEEIVMNIDAHVTSLIANEQTRFKEDDRKWLMAMTEDQLEALVPVEAAAPNDDDGGTEGGESRENSSDANCATIATGVATLVAAQEASSVAAAVVPVPQTVDEYIKKAPHELQEVLGAGLSMHRARKAHLVKGLLANERNTFTEEQLGVMDIQQLEAMAQLADVPTYDVAAGGASIRDQSSEDDGFAEAPPSMFEKAS